MFATPTIARAAVHTRVPPELDLAGKGRASSWLSDRPYHAGPIGSFLEGPSFDRAGNLYCVDIAYGRIFRIDPEGRFETTVEYNGAPNGLKIHRDGRLFVADHRKGLVTIDPADRKVSVLLERAHGEPFKGLNDLVFASNGDLYFTDQGQSGLQDPSGRVYRLRADGRLELVLDRIPSPNGLVLSSDERTLFLAVTRANQIWRLPIGPDGRTSKVGVFLNLSGGGGPDGLAMDVDDTLYVCQPLLGAVLAFDRYGDPVTRIQSGSEGRMLTNLAFGGPENRTLHITDSGCGCIQTMQVDRPGRAMFSHG